MSKLWVSDILIDHGNGFELFLFDVVVTGLEINVLEVDFGVDGQGLHFIRVGRWFGSEL
jgi:hypothetical protein